MYNVIFMVILLFALLDGIYITLISGQFRSMVQEITNKKSDISFDIVSAIMTYVVMVFMLWYFILKEKRSPFEAALFGSGIYAIYDFTNKATLPGWTWSFSIMDTIWGGVLFGTTTWIVQNFI